MSQKWVLIIDDEKDFGQLVKMNLELLGSFKVATAFNGKDGVKTALQIKPDLILLDIVMPKMDGFEVLKRLKEHPDTLNIPVVMLTARDDDVAKLKSLQLYNDGYITKPVDPNELKAKIEEVFKMRGIA